MGLDAAFGGDSADLSARAIEEIRGVVQQEDLKTWLYKLKRIVEEDIPTYRNKPTKEKLARINRNVAETASQLEKHAAANKIRRAYQPYQMARAIEVRTFQDLCEKYRAATPADAHRTAKLAMNGLLDIESTEHDRLTFHGFALFKHYSIDGGSPASVHRDLPPHIRGANPDIMISMGDKYHEVMTGFLGKLAADARNAIPKAKYVCKLVEPSRVTLRGDWMGTDARADFYACFESGGYHPVGDAVFFERARPVLHVKPRAESPVFVSSWTRVWDDRSADREDSYPRGRGPYGLFYPDRSRSRDRMSFGGMIAKLSGSRPADEPRILMLPLEDLDVSRAGQEWKDTGSGADEDVSLDIIHGDDRGEEYPWGVGGLFNPSTSRHSGFPYWLKKATLKGY
jgi:hypothetical protein